MAEEFASKTEAPTPRRREEAREQGQVTFSPDLTATLVLLAGVAGLSFLGSHFGRELISEVRTDFLRAATNLEAEEVPGLLGGLFLRALGLSGALFGVLLLAGLAGSLGQVGFQPNFELLGFRWERLLPFGTPSRLFSFEKVGLAIVSLLKLTAVGAIAFWVVTKIGPRIPHIGQGRLMDAAIQAWAAVMTLAFSLVGCLFLFGVIDYLLKWWRFERSIRMSKQEIKDELKREEGDPLVKARVRRLQRETAQKKMYREVKTATVVVTNPTHLAVAIKYDRATMRAPRVVARGAGFVAQRLVELARGSGVPVLERKPLARALFKSVKLNQEIPSTLYLAVAEVLAYLYRLRGGMGAAPAAPRTA
jgi:flagellar biosynthetic protein FlhB